MNFAVVHSSRSFKQKQFNVRNASTSGFPFGGGRGRDTF